MDHDHHALTLRLRVPLTTMHAGLEGGGHETHDPEGTGATTSMPGTASRCSASASG
jgi:hypothetical protein